MNTNIDDYKKKFINFEQNLSKDETLDEILDYFQDFDLTNSSDESLYFINNCLPQIALKVLKISCPDENRTHKYIRILKHTLKIIYKSLNSLNLHPNLLKVLTLIFDLDSKFYVSRLGYNITEDDIDENSYLRKPKHMFIQKSSVYIDVIDFWGKLNGFDAMLNEMERENCDISVIACFLESIRNLKHSSHLKDSKYEELMNRIWFSVVPKLKKVNIETLKQAKKEDIESVISLLSSLAFHTNIERSEVNKVTENLSLDFASKCLKSGALEKRLYAISYISSIIKSYDIKYGSHNDTVTKNFLLSWIRANDVIGNIFGESKHIQLIKNSSRILKFLLVNDDLDEKSLDLIWSCATNAHESLSKDTFALISEIAPSLDNKHVHIILMKLYSIPYEQYNRGIISFIADMTHRCDHDDMRVEFLELLWSIMSTKKVSQDLVYSAYYCFLNLTKQPFFIIHRSEYLRKLIDSLKTPLEEGKVYYFNLISTIFQTYETSKKKSESRITLYETIETLNHEYDFLNFLIHEFKRFQSYCSEKLENIDDVEEYLKANYFPFQHYYINEIKSRLEVLYNVIMKASVQVDQNFLVSELWNLLYKNALSSIERNECIIWFKCAQFSPEDEQSSLDISVVPYLFESFISKMDPKTMNKFSLECYKRFFYLSNVYLNKMKWTNKENQEVVVLEPGDLIGEKELWNITIQCPNQEVVTGAMDILNECYKNLPNNLDDSLTKVRIRKHYIHQCLQFMSTAANDLITSKDETVESIQAHELCVERSLSSIIKMMNSLESSSSYKYSFMTRGTPIHLHITVKYIDNDQPKSFSFQLETHSNEIVRQVYNQILSLCNDYFNQINIPLGYIVPDVSYDFEDTSNTLNQIGIKSHQHFTFIREGPIPDRLTKLKPRSSHRKNNRPINAKTLIEKVQELSGLDKELTEMILEKYRWDIDRVLSQIMNEANLKRLINELKSNDSTQSNIEIIETINERLDYLFKEDNHEEIDPSLPSSILSSDPSYINDLFSVLSIQNQKIIESAWKIITGIPISHSIKDSLISMPDNPNWNELLPNDVFRLLYRLKIVDQLLFPYNESRYIEKVTEWSNWFFKTNAIGRIIVLLIELNDNVKKLSSRFYDQYYSETITLLNKILNHYFIKLRDNSSDLKIDNLEQLKNSILSSLYDNKNGFVFDKVFIHYSFKNLIDTYTFLDNNTNSSLFDVIPHLEDIIKEYLFNNDHNIRVEMSRLLYDKFVMYNGSTRKSLYEILHTYLSGLTEISHSSVYEEYFWLFPKVIESMFDDNEFSSLSNLESLTNRFIHIIKDRKVLETHMSSPTDWILCGAISSLSVVFSRYRTYESSNSLLNDLCNFIFVVEDSNGITLPKCKTKPTRNACFNLIIELSSMNSENFQTFLQFLSKQHLGSVQKISSWNHDPTDEDKSPTGYVGLVNLGATCYMSSLLQQFYMIPNLKRDIFDVKLDQSTIDPSQNVLGQLQMLFGYLQESEKLSYNPREFINSYRDIEGNIPKVNQQQDVNEFFNILCLRIENQLRNTPFDRVLHKHFVGILSNEIRSADKNYQYFSEREEEFYTIPLDVGNRNNFESAMDLFIQSDKLEGDNQYFCEKFNTKINATKRCVLKKLPKTLIFHLMRFDYDLATNNKKKLNNFFHFPMYVNMKPWTKDGLKEIEKNENEEDGSYEPINDSYDYELCGILIHAGIADSGHYYSLIKERTYPYRWLQFNDRVVTEFDPNKIGQECFGGLYETVVFDHHLGKNVKKEVVNDRNAYMLFYEKVDKSSKVKQDDNVELEQVNKAKVPEEVYKAVWHENSSFLKDRLVFDPQYFNFILNFVQQLKIDGLIPFTDAYIDKIDNEGYDNEDQQLSTIKLATRFSLEMLSHAKFHEGFSWWLTFLRECYKHHIPACVWFIEYVKRNNIILENLLSCTHERMRIEVGDLIISIIKTLIEHNVFYKSKQHDHEPDVPAYKVLMKHILDLLEQTRSHWKRFKQYFEVIKNFALIGKEQRRYLLDYGILALYQDYFMGANRGRVERVSVMDDEYLPDLVEFYDTISILIRGCYNEATNRDVLPPNRLCDDLIEMPEGWSKVMWERRFLRSFLDMDYNTPAACEIVSYASFNAIKRSDMIMDIIIDELEGCSISKSQVFERLFESIILIQDDEDNIQHRIRNYVSSYQYNKKNGSSLIKIAKSITKPIEMIIFVLELASRSEPLFKFLSTSRDIYWIIDTYESQIEEEFFDFFINDELIEEDIKKGYYKVFITKDIPDELNNDFRKWRKSEMYFGLLYAHYIAKQKSHVESYDSIIKEYSNNVKKLRNDLEESKNMLASEEKFYEHLKEQVSILKEIVNHFKKISGDDSKNDVNNILDLVEKEDDDNQTENYDLNMGIEDKDLDTIFEKDNEIVRSLPLIPDRDHLLDERLAQIKEFLGDHIEDEVLKEALSENGYDINSAVNDLFDEQRLNHFRNKVKARSLN